jgi:hypothetical protein
MTNAKKGPNAVFSLELTEAGLHEAVSVCECIHRAEDRQVFKDSMAFQR